MVFLRNCFDTARAFALKTFPMKLILLAVAFALLGGWYCYDKYGGDIFAGKFNADPPADPRVEAIEKRGMELFPTKEKQRERWIADQKSAMAKISQRRRGVPASMGDEIRALAEKKFPGDYDRQHSFVMAQETAALAIKDAVNSFGLSREESSAVIEAVARIYAGDYTAQASSVMRLGDALSAVKEKWKDVPKSDYSLILKNTLEKMNEDPDAAVRYFDRQFLARHNFLMKKFPPEFGNLREGIQEMFPSDFCAQLAELDSRLDAAFLKGKPAEAYDGGKKQTEDFFYKNVFIKQAGGMSFCCYFVEVAGKKAFLFPAEMLEHVGGELKFDYGDVVFKSSDIYVSPDSMFACAAVSGDVPASPVEFCPPSDIPESFEGKRIAIIGANRDGARRSIYPVMKKGAFALGVADYSKVANLGAGGAMVVDADSRKLLGLIELSPSNGIEFFGGFDATYVSTSPSQMPGCEPLIKNLESAVRQDLSGRARLVPIDPESFKSWRKFDAGEYALEGKILADLCALNYWAVRFVRTNTFVDALGSARAGRAAGKYKYDFLEGPRLHKSLFFRKYSDYIREVLSDMSLEADRIAKNTPKNPYYRYAAPLSAQSEIFKSVSAYLSGLSRANSDAGGFLHVDLNERLDGDSYKPKTLISKERMNEILSF